MYIPEIPITVEHYFYNDNSDIAFSTFSDGFLWID